MNYDVIERVALGRCAQLGDLYNIYRDQFTNSSVFSEPDVIESLTVRTDLNLPFETFFTLQNDSPFNLLKLMSVPADQIYGLIFDTHEGRMTGYDNFANFVKKHNVRAVRGALVITKFVYEEITDFELIKKKAVVRDTVGENLREGSHAVSGITWGCRTVVFLDCPIHSEGQQKENSKVLKDLLKKFQTSVSDLSKKFQTSVSDLSTFDIDPRNYCPLDMSVVVYGEVSEKWRSIDNLQSLVTGFPMLLGDMSIRPRPIKYTMSPVLKIATRVFEKLDTDTTFFPLLNYQIRDVCEYIFEMRRIVAEYHQGIQLLKRQATPSRKLLKMVTMKRKVEDVIFAQETRLTIAIKNHRKGTVYFRQRDFEEIRDLFSLNTLISILRGEILLA